MDGRTGSGHFFVHADELQKVVNRLIVMSRNDDWYLYGLCLSIDDLGLLKK